MDLAITYDDEAEVKKLYVRRTGSRV